MKHRPDTPTDRMSKRDAEVWLTSVQPFGGEGSVIRRLEPGRVASFAGASRPWWEREELHQIDTI